MMKSSALNKTQWLGLALGCYALFVGTRIYLEKSSGAVKGGVRGAFISSRFDPRNLDRVDTAGHKREADRFQERLQAKNPGIFYWPGVKAFQVSLSWLELLQGVHNEKSYEGDFSWVFSKLDFIYRATPKDETAYVIALAPFYFLMNKDGAGSTYLLNSMVTRAPGMWRVWFWSGFHALENLKNFTLAGDLYQKAALLPGSPMYLGALSVRLSHKELFDRIPNPKRIIKNDLPPELYEKVKATRPEWLE